ncbi:GntR family transcriptional regulator [Ahrensia kielensis]|uniref:GntR family transcriptional regulator n=1 Tax=Ahrensia kielensis TaxID=76980 RepID=UPI001FE03213|nr:GntR family transcriptional regulator [Ahrensia kielensis]
MAIIEMRFNPGEALSEKEISLKYGVSRQPVREAFIKLSEAGLVEIRPSRGTYVSKISVRRVADARLVREAVECSLVRNATRLAKPKDIDFLDELLEEQDQAFSEDNFNRFNRSDNFFHRAIANIVQCDYALKTVEGARNEIDRVRYLSLGIATPMKRLIEQHRNIVSAIRSGEPDAADKAMREHLREILLALPHLAEVNPDIFEDRSLPEHTIQIINDISH